MSRGDDGRNGKRFTVAFGVLALVCAVSNFTLATEYRYQGVEVLNLRTAFNQNATYIQNVLDAVERIAGDRNTDNNKLQALQDDLEDVVAKLNGLGTADEILTTSFAITSSGTLMSPDVAVTGTGSTTDTLGP